MDEERRHRVYALNSDSKDITPDEVMMAVTPPMPFDATAVGGNGHANGHANEGAAGGNAAGETPSGAPAPEDAALRNASAEQAQEQENGGYHFCLI